LLLFVLESCLLCVRMCRTVGVGMKKQAPRQFFEVFRQPVEGESSHAGLSRKSPALERSAGGSAKGRRIRLSGRGMTFSHEAIAIFVLALVVVIVASHVWGYYRGRASHERPGVHEVAIARSESVSTAMPAATEARETSRRTEQGRTTTLSIPAPTEVQTPFYTLRIISQIPLKNARRIRDDLRAKGYDAFVYQPRSQSGYTVNVARFPSIRSAKARALKDEFNRMVYRRERLFESCYLIQIDNPRRIVP